MLKALLKKQLSELAVTMLGTVKVSKGKTRRRSPVLMIFVYLLLAASMFAISAGIGEALLSSGRDWLYFSMLSMLALVFGLFGSVFSTYASLYLSKDNDLLLSMPIPPMHILLSRMVAVVAAGLLYAGLVWIPGLIFYWITMPSTVLQVVCSVLLMFVITAFVCVLSCLLGWVVALLSQKLKGKSYVSTVLSVAFIALYYYCYSQAAELLAKVALHLDALSGAVKTWLYPAYLTGMAATGSVLHLLQIAVIAAVLCAACVWVMSRSFVKIVTMSGSAAKAKARKARVEAMSAGRTLLHRELQRFAGSSIYMLNAGLGLLIMPVLAVLGIINCTQVKVLAETLAMMGGLRDVLPVALMLVFGMIASMDCISAPSVSLEGKQIWIVQSMPVSSWDVLRAKERLHVLLNGTVALMCAAILGIVLQVPAVDLLLLLYTLFALIVLCADFGLWIGTVKANLDWTNENIPIKQGMPVTVSVFGAWGLLLLLGAGCWFSRKLFSGTVYLLLCAAVLTAAVLLLRRVLRTRTAERFRYL